MITSTEERVQNRYLENYMVLREQAPNLLKKFHGKGDSDWRVVVGKDGSLNAIFKGEYLYPYNPKKLAKDQVEELMKDPKRVLVPAPLFFSKGTKSKLIHFKYMSEMLELAGGEERDIGFVYDRKNIPVMVVFGMGFGYHVIELIRRFNIQHMIVIEPTPELFNLSLYSIDWKEVLSYFKREGRSFNVIIGDEVEKLKGEINRRFAFINPALTFYIFFFEHFSSPVFDKVKDWITTEVVESPLLWGFFDDELWSLEHTVGNIRNKVPLFYGSAKAESDIPVFIIGSGPSLDKSLDIIKKLSDSAILVSCGTALGALHKAGIKPDIHVEIERSETVYKVLSEIDSKFMKEIPIVGMNTLYPKVFKLGKKGYMFLKPNDAGSALFPADIPRIYNSNPTVTAGALSIMAHAGFKKFYLFGVDLGTKDKEKHHSKLSNYYSESSVLGKKPLSMNYDRVLKGNFGGEVLSNNIFYFTKISIENNIANLKLEVYNTSDGAKIEGSHPLQPEDISLQKRGDKDKVLRKFFTNFKDTYRRDVNLEKVLRESREDFDIYMNEFAPRLSHSSGELSEVIQLFSDMHFYLLALAIRRKIKGEYMLRNLIGPTMYQLHKVVLATAFSTREEEKRREFLGKAYGVIGRYLQESGEVLKKLSF